MKPLQGLFQKTSVFFQNNLYHLIPALNLRNYMQPAAKGKTLNKKILQRIKIPVPDLDEQEKFVEQMNNMEAQRIDLQGQVKDLEQHIADTSRTFLAKQ